MDTRISTTVMIVPTLITGLKTGSQSTVLAAVAIVAIKGARGLRLIWPATFIVYIHFPKTNKSGKNSIKFSQTSIPPFIPLDF